MKKTLVFAIAAGVMWIGSAEVCAVNYYVDATGGNNSWNGRYPSYEGGVSGPWRTIAKVNARNIGNDDVVSFKRGGIFNDATLTLDGTSAGRSGITVQDYGTGNKPRFDGNVIQPIYINHALVNLTVKNIDISGWNTSWHRAAFRYVNGITIDGVDFDGHDGTNTFAGVPTVGYSCVYPYPSAGWVYIVLDIDKNDYGDITIKNCTISNLLKSDGFAASKTAWCKNDMKAIRLSSESAGGKTSGTVYIHNNVITNIYSDIIQTNGMQVEQHIYDNIFIGFGENFLDVKGTRYCKVYNNIISGGNIGKDPGAGWFGPCSTTFHDPSGLGLPFGDHEIYNNYIYGIYGDGLYLSGENIKAYNNHIKDCLLGIRITSHGCEVYSNIIETTSSVEQDPDNSYCGRYRSGILLCGNYAYDNTVYNNTIYISNNLDDYGIALEECSALAANKIENNIVYITKNSGSVYPLWWDGDGTDPTVNYNLYHNPNHTNRIYWTGTIYDSGEQSDWRDAGHPEALFIDPLFVNQSAGNFVLQPDSPAVDAGTNLGSPYNLGLNPASTWPSNVSTLDQNNYGTGWEIGAYVWAETLDGDFDDDGCVDLADFAILASYWMNEDVCPPPDWCGGADFDMSGTIDMLDLAYFARNWLRQTW